MRFAAELPAPAAAGVGLAVAATLLALREWASAAVTLMLVAAAAGVVAAWEHAARVAVFVDASPSTRTAFWRQHDATRDLPYAVTSRHAFADAAVEVEAGSADELPADATRLDVSAHAGDVDAAVLFTDGRLTLATHLPTYFVVDPALDTPGDASADLLVREQARVVTRTRLDDSATSRVVGELFNLDVSHDDAWPENNRLVLGRATSAAGLPVTVGGARPGFVTVPAGRVTDAAVAAAPFVLVETGNLTDADARVLARHVAAHGGTLAYASHDVPPDILAEILPLSFQKPDAPRRLTLLLDTSGSMAGHEHALAAATHAARNATNDVPLDVLAFANDATWVARDLRPDEPLDIPSAGGPTNLDGALNAALRANPHHILIVGDGDARISDDTRDAVARADVIIHLLDTADAPADDVIRLVRDTGGNLITASAPAGWPDAARRITRATREPDLRNEPARLEGPGVAADVAIWRETSVKPAAIDAADADVGVAGWDVGAGHAVAFAANLPDVDLTPLVEQLAATPATGVYATITDGPVLEINVFGGHGSLRITRGDEELPVTRIAPGVRRARLAGPRGSAVVVVREEGRLVHAAATASRFAPEFDAIGNDLPAVLAHARRTGGSVTANASTLNIPGRPARHDPTTWLCILAAAGACVLAVREHTRPASA